MLSRKLFPQLSRALTTFQVQNLIDAERTFDKIRSDYGEYDAESLSVQGALFSIKRRKIKQFHMYGVKEEPRLLGVVQETTEYSQVDTDWIWLLIKLDDKSSDDRAMLKEFINKINRERNWKDRGVFLCHVDYKWTPTIGSIVRNCFIDGPTLQYMATEELMRSIRDNSAKSIEARKKRLEESLPHDIFFDFLHPSEAEHVAAFSQAPFPAKVDFFRYLIKYFPQSAVRHKETNKLVGWRMIYPHASGGHGYLEPKYRGKGLLFLMHDYEYINRGKDFIWDTMVFYGDAHAASKSSIKSMENYGMKLVEGCAPVWMVRNPKSDEKFFIDH